MSSASEEAKPASESHERYSAGVWLRPPSVLSPPETAAEARRCLPLGYGVKAVGLRLQTGETDLIWEAMVEQNLSSGGGKVKRTLDRTVEAVADARLAKPRAARLLARAQRRAAPANPALAGEIQALPSGNDEV
jgi:hypothetical protein